MEKVEYWFALVKVVTVIIFLLIGCLTIFVLWAENMLVLLILH